jgi:hypothetical protein
MAIVDLESTASALVADGKGILAADETPRIMRKWALVCQVANCDPHWRGASHRRLSVGERTRARAVRDALSGAGPGTHR